MTKDKMRILDLEIQLERLLHDRLSHTSEQECLNCHQQFRAFANEKFCTRACEMGWTPARKYEDMYKEMHPQSPWLQPPAR